MHQVEADAHREPKSAGAGRLWPPECASLTHGASACTESVAFTCTTTRTRSDSAPRDVAPLSQGDSPVKRPPLGQHSNQRVLALRPLSSCLSGSGAPSVHPPSATATTHHRRGHRLAIRRCPDARGPLPHWTKCGRTRASPHCGYACGIRYSAVTYTARTRACVQNTGRCLRGWWTRAPNPRVGGAHPGAWSHPTIRVPRVPSRARVRRGYGVPLAARLRRLWPHFEAAAYRRPAL